jgi:hypothetical protein
MSHGATINIENRSECVMELSDGGNVCHGKFTAEPPKTIPVNETLSFRVSPVDGGSIGPKGWVAYNLLFKTNENKAITETIRIFWDHPVGSGKTRYEVSSQPYKIDYELDGKTTGTEQTITLKFTKIHEDVPSAINIIGCDH